MRKLRNTNLNREQLLAMVMHSQNRAARLCALRSAGDSRDKLLAVITRACSAVSMWHELYAELEKKEALSDVVASAIARSHKPPL